MLKKKLKKPVNKLRNEDYLICEVKHQEEIPDHIKEALDSCDCKEARFSKYCGAIVTYIKTGKQVNNVQRQKVKMDAQDIIDILESDGMEKSESIEWFGKQENDMPELKTDLKKPFKSKAQQKYMYANPDILGQKVLKEWQSKTNESKLPLKKDSEWFENEIKEDKVKKREEMFDMFDDLGLLKSIGQLTFNKLPKMANQTRPDANVKQINSPISAAVSARVAANNAKEKNVKQFNDKIANKNHKGASLTHTEDGLTGKSHTYTHANAGKDTLHHEGMHHSLQELSRRHGLNEDQHKKVVNHFVNMIHPDDRKAIELGMASNGYDLNHPAHHEELLAHVHNTLEGNKDTRPEHKYVPKVNGKVAPDVKIKAGNVSNAGINPDNMSRTKKGLVNKKPHREVSDLDVNKINRRRDGKTNNVPKHPNLIADAHPDNLAKEKDKAEFKRKIAEHGLEGSHKKFDKTRLRDSWNNIRHTAKHMDEKKLHEIANK